MHRGHGRARFVAQALRIRGHGPPAETVDAKLGHGRLDQLLAPAKLFRVAQWQKKEAHRHIRFIRQLPAQFDDFGAEEGRGNLRQDPGAVSGLGVGIQGAPVRQIPQRLQGEFENSVLAPAIRVGHETDAAGVMFKLRII